MGQVLSSVYFCIPTNYRMLESGMQEQEAMAIAVISASPVAGTNKFLIEYASQTVKEK